MNRSVATHLRSTRALWLALLLPLAHASAASLAERIERLLESSPVARSAFWGIRVTDLGTGQTVYQLNADRFFVPASNAKLFSTALALTRLGPDFTFQTRVLAGAPPDELGRIRGSLRLVGGGDPNLSGRPIPYRMGASFGSPLLAVYELADQVAARGVRRIEGDILGDDSWYVWQPYPEGWALDDPQYDYGAPVSALSLNDNTLTISVRPGARVGDPAELVLKPALSYYEIDNRIRTMPAGSARKVMLSRDPGSSQIRLWGTIPQRDRGQDLALGIEDPALYAARALRQALTVRGIAVEGGAAAVHLFPNDVPDLSGPAPSERTEVAAVELARRISAPLLEDLRVTAKESQNLHAEMALRAVGRARRGVGSREAGLEELKAFLNEAGLDPESYTMNDGSGLSRLDLVTPSAIVRLLTYMYGSPQRDNWLSILPVGGQDGTLSDRFGEGAAAGRILAKTGTLSHVSSLSGYAARPNGSWFAFSILVNNYRARSAEVRGVIDRICTLILE